ncbi:uncharacterized protein TNCV_995141 [Trichonephila clavipes]|nr:uncharacterized protein TNCV_995141 [Trichonephila clavipes]
MEVTRVEQRAYIKIAVLQMRNLPCDFDLISKIKERLRGRRFATREDIANVVRQQATRFTQEVANADADGIQRLPHRLHRVVPVAGDYIEVFKPSKIKVAMVQLKNVMMAEKVNGKCILDGVDEKFLDLLAKKLNFELGILQAPYSQYGSSNKNGAWDVVIRMIQNGKADMGFGALSITEERLEVIDFSMAYNVLVMTHSVEYSGLNHNAVSGGLVSYLFLATFYIHSRIAGHAQFRQRGCACANIPPGIAMLQH